MLIYSKRLALAKHMEAWCKDRRGAPETVNHVSALVSFGLLDPEKVKRFLEEQNQTMENDGDHESK